MLWIASRQGVCSQEKSLGSRRSINQAYSVALKYFYECTGENTPIKDITRSDLIKFATFLRDERVG
ncbi:MAG TPA: hypothetical protein VFA74_11950 [Terriglobales bacterium]|nr:hypothetical protein [Terriglobales bacterium]